MVILLEETYWRADFPDPLGNEKSEKKTCEIVLNFTSNRTHIKKTNSDFLSPWYLKDVFFLENIMVFFTSPNLCAKYSYIDIFLI